MDKATWIMTDKRKDIVYRWVDAEGLSVALAEEAWKQETRNEKPEELWETIVTKNDVIKQIKPVWANVFFGLQHSYKLLINQYCKYPLPEDEIE